MTRVERDRAIARAIDHYTTANTASPEVARSVLIREGIYTSDGRLRPEYGGVPDEPPTEPTVV